MFSFLNPYMLWVKLAGALVAFVAIFGAGMWFMGTIKDREIMTMQADRAKAQTVSVTASLKQLQTFISTMQLAAIDYEGNQDALFAALDKLHQDFLTTSNLKPLPVDCHPDPDRLRILAASVAAANAAASGHLLSRPLRGPQ